MRTLFLLLLFLFLGIAASAKGGHCGHGKGHGGGHRSIHYRGRDRGPFPLSATPPMPASTWVVRRGIAEEYQYYPR